MVFPSIKISESNHLTMTKTTSPDAFVDEKNINWHKKVKLRTVSNLEGDDDDGITSSDITMHTLCIHQAKVHSFYVRFTLTQIISCCGLS